MTCRGKIFFVLSLWAMRSSRPPWLARSQEAASTAYAEIRRSILYLHMLLGRHRHRVESRNGGSTDLLVQRPNRGCAIKKIGWTIHEQFGYSLNCSIITGTQL